MDEKKTNTLAEVMADIAVTPVALAHMAVKARKKMGDNPPKGSQIAGDIKDAAEKTKAKLQELEVGQKIKEKVQNIQDSDVSYKVKNFAYQVQDNMTDNIIKAKDDFQEFRERAASRTREAADDIQDETRKEAEVKAETAETEDMEKELEPAEEEKKDATDILFEMAQE